MFTRSTKSMFICFLYPVTDLSTWCSWGMSLPNDIVDHSNYFAVVFQMSHAATSAFCRSIKLQCELYPSREVAICLDPYCGLGFVLWCLCRWGFSSTFWNTVSIVLWHNKPDDVSDKRMGRTENTSGSDIGNWNCWKLYGEWCTENMLCLSRAWA